jgi:hypothetical protein
VEYIDKAGELKAYIHTQKTSWAGTGFLLNDGRFVTSRKVIERWYYRYSDKDIDKWVEDLHKHVDAANKNSVIAHFSARSAAGGSLSFTSDQFSIDRTDDRYDSKLDLHLAPVSSAKDLVYTNISLGGGLKFNPSLARGLNAGDELTILGFPASLGVNYAAGPTLGKATSSNNGLAMGLISVTSSSSLLEGAGVPVFKPNQSGELEVVGVSTALSNSIVPIRNMQ